jgi:hypothetical protein
MWVGNAGRLTLIASMLIAATVILAPTAVTAEAIRTCDGKPATMTYGNGDNDIIGTPGQDVIVAGGGDDFIVAGEGRDRVCGEGGRDLVYGETGGDFLLSGGRGIDHVDGSSGDDFISGGDDRDGGNDVTWRETNMFTPNLIGGDGADRLFGGNGSDDVFGRAGADDISGGDGNDALRGDEGDDGPRNRLLQRRVSQHQGLGCNSDSDRRRGGRLPRPRRSTSLLAGVAVSVERPRVRSRRCASGGDPRRPSDSQPAPLGSTQRHRDPDTALRDGVHVSRREDRPELHLPRPGVCAQRGWPFGIAASA